MEHDGLPSTVMPPPAVTLTFDLLTPKSNKHIYELRGRKSREDRGLVPDRGTRLPEFGVGTLMQIVPPYFVMLQNLKDQIACITFTMQKNVMSMLAVIAIAVSYI